MTIKESCIKQFFRKAKIRKERVFVVGAETLNPQEIPSISVRGETLPEAWETAVLATLEFGTQIPTEYDQEKDPESRDASMMIVVTDPLKEPRIHKALPVGLGDLEVYVREIVDGIRDNRVGDRGWSYSYHDRLCNWPGVGSWKKIKKLDGLDLELPNVDQISALINKLAVAPHSRRAQAITWTPFIDATHHEPPCLQRIWCRVVKTTDGQHLLQMNTHWRSRDGFKAAFMNMYGMIELQKEIAQRISEISGREIGVGRYLDISDSFHIYGSDFRKGDVDRFKRGIKRSFEDKTFRSDDPLVQREFAKGKDKAGIGNIKR